MSDKIRVLLLEDDIDLRNALQGVLELSEYEVCAAGNGTEAVDKASDYPFDIFVFDIKLPGPDGLEVLAQFKKENPDLLSVVMTGYATEKDTLRALRLGVGDYLKKPFKAKVLLEAVQRLEAEVHRRRELEGRESAARELVTWSLQVLLGRREMVAEADGLSFSECGRIALAAALASGHSKAKAQRLQIAVLLHFFNQGEDKHQHHSILGILPAATVELAQQLGESPNQEAPHSLLDIGKKCCQLRFDKSGLQELEQLAGSKLKTAQSGEQAKGRRHLLSLGRTLLASQDVDAAKSAFVKITSNSRSKESGLAYLELAKIAWFEGDKSACKDNFRKLLELVPLLGPQSGTELEAQAGFAALAMGLTDGQKLLEKSETKLAKLGLEGIRSQTLIGLAAARMDLGGEEVSKAITYQAQRGLGELLLNHSEWLLPKLLKLELQGTKTAEALLSKLIREATRSVGRVLLTKLEPDTLELLLKYVVQTGSPALEPSLQKLFAQTKDNRVKALVDKILQGFSETESPKLRIYSLGAFEVWVGDHQLSQKAWRTYRSKNLLACLASRGASSILSEVIIEQFWPGVRPDAGKKNLSQTSSDLRKTLSEAGFDLADELLVRKHDVIGLNPEVTFWHDLLIFDEEFKRGKAELSAGQARKAYPHLRQAFTLVRGTYLEDCSMDWISDPRREVERKVLECCELLSQLCAQLERYPEAIEAANRALDSDPCHQRLHIQIMDCYVKMERADLALRQFDEAKRALMEEWGVEPSVELIKAQQLAKLAQQ